MESVRPARPDDRPSCLALLDTALGEARSARGGAALVGDATGDQLMERWLDGSTASIVHVGEFDHVVVGLAAATASVRRHDAQRSGKIECCYVDKDARGVGVGTALLQSMVAWCAEMGCDDVDALALPGDRRSKQRLEAAGFTARLLVLNRRLS